MMSGVTISERELRALSACSLAAKGLYVSLNALAVGGVITRTTAQIAEALGISQHSAGTLLGELQPALLREGDAGFVLVELRKRALARERMERSRSARHQERNGCAQHERNGCAPPAPAPPALPPNDELSPYQLPAYHSDLIKPAEDVLKHYKRAVKDTHALAVGLVRGWVMKWMLAGHTADALKRAADNYAAHCDRNGIKRDKRVAAMKFFGEARVFEEHLQTAAQPPEVDNITKLRQQERERIAQSALHQGLQKGNGSPGVSPTSRFNRA